MSIPKLLTDNPYRVLGVYSNSSLRDRVANQNRLNAFAKVGKEASFPSDFCGIIADKPIRTTESVSSAITALNLDKEQLKYALFWFINGSPIDDIALHHLQSGNIEKARELFTKKESYSSLINVGVLALIGGDVTTAFRCISNVVHSSAYRAELFQALGIANLQLTEDELAEMFISELVKEIPAKALLCAATNPIDRAIIGKIALDEPISAINSAVALAKNADSKNPVASLAAGTKLMNSTKAALKTIRDIAGADSPQYQMAADNVAKQVLQCSIHYYNNASETDFESPRKAMVLQAYALEIAVGQLTKDRCKQNCDILKQAVDNMPPAEVALEVRKVRDELKKFCQLPDKISHSVTLINNTKPLLQIIKAKLGATNTFYLSLSTQVVTNALFNLVAEVNEAQNYLAAVVKAAEKSGISPAILNYLGGENSPSQIIDTKIKPIVREAWKATIMLDSFDMEAEFKTERYNPNREALKDLCKSLHISTLVTSPSSTTPRTTTPRTTTPSTTTPSTTTPRTTTQRTTGARTTTASTTTHPGTTTNSSTTSTTTKQKKNGWPGFWIATIICAVIGAMAKGVEGFFVAGFFGAVVFGNMVRSIIEDD